MLVVQRVVVAKEEGEVEYPSDLLEEMRQRFLTRGSRTAFDWICRLRAYAKRLVSNATLPMLQCGKCSENKVFNRCSVLRSAASAELQKDQQQGLFT
jgi:hypothetical protein